MILGANIEDFRCFVLCLQLTPRILGEERIWEIGVSNHVQSKVNTNKLHSLTNPKECVSHSFESNVNAK